VAIYVRDGKVIVRAPMRTPVREIDGFVESKLAWIERHIALWRKREEQRNDLDSAQIREKLTTFYKTQAQDIIEERVHYYSSIMGVRPSNIKIGSAKKSWASCSTAGRLIFSWRLMAASPDAIDYVIVHELAHLKHMNHSYRFWDAVSKVMPDWKSRRKELRLLQKRLSDEGWD